MNKFFAERTQSQKWTVAKCPESSSLMPRIVSPLALLLAASAYCSARDIEFNRDVRPIFAKYLPSELTHDEYPALIPDGTSVSTIGNRSLLVTYSWPENSVRYNKVAKFVREFFGRIDQFHDGARHPKWEEISLAAEIPGWVRFKPAADWLAEHRNVALRPAFDQFVQNYAQSTGQKMISDRDREALFVKFQQFLQSQMTSPAAAAR